jgi:hypothetical protein
VDLSSPLSTQTLEQSMRSKEKKRYRNLDLGTTQKRLRLKQPRNEIFMVIIFNVISTDGRRLYLASCRLSCFEIMQGTIRARKKRQHPSPLFNTNFFSSYLALRLLSNQIYNNLVFFSSDVPFLFTELFFGVIVSA